MSETELAKCRDCKNELPLTPDGGGVVFHDVAIAESGSTGRWWTQCAGSGLPPIGA